jgi:hypothetical protein
VNQNLSDAIRARDTAAAEVDAIGAKISKLESGLAQTCPAVGELAALRAAAQAAALSWDGEGPLPTIDHKQAARLQDEIAAFDASKASAQAAVKTLVDRRNAATQARNEANARAEIAALSQILAEFEPRFVEEIKAAAQVYVDLVASRNEMRRFILAEANRRSDYELNRAIEHSHVLFETPVGVANMDGINSRLRDLLTSKEA